ncbi:MULTISPECIES: MFS transporter [Clostridium]|uniref:MFS transporter n=1 Tax=Clostridium TaxID=1485 RepID=UPI00069D55FA|nr:MULTISPECIES: MFS transporter [Clostridium]KOF57067.1 Major Facilitator superfamily [Clostridium sp. DMHC 10]MCD2348945.1 MFS transporter [Clostridium guangxiense]
MKRSKLWTKDFSLITFSTILSVIGGQAMDLPISLLVFDKTKSTFLSAIIMVCGMLPNILFSIAIAPIIDKRSKKKWIVRLDILMTAIYFLTGIYVLNHPFNYALYVIFTLVVGTISVFYHLSYSSWYPDLIPAGMEQKGYAVSGTIYPTVSIVMAPFAALLYKNLPLGYIFIAVSILTLIAVISEVNITETISKTAEKYDFRQYKNDIKEGFAFLKKEKGIRNIYTYMSITNGASDGISVITQAFYQTQPWLTVTMLGFLKSAETLGRVFGGLFQYKKEIPSSKRYSLTKFVYIFYDSMDSVLLFMPYPLMLINRFLCGALGTTSATLREAAVQSYLPQSIRTRINAFFNVIFAAGGIVFQLAAGSLGQFLSYRIVALSLGLFTLSSAFIFICLPAKENRKVYEATKRAV